MPSKILRRKAKLVIRGGKKTKKHHKKQMRNYLGGGKYTHDENFNNANRVMYQQPDAAVYWLTRAKDNHPEDDEIDELIERLETSQKLLNDVQKRIDELVS